MSEPLKEGQDVSCVLACMFAVLYGLNYVSNRWKWGSSNVTGKVDEVVTEGQAQIQSNKVRIPCPYGLL
jgi:hypothetical protein